MNTDEKYLNDLIARCFSYGLIDDFCSMMTFLGKHTGKGQQRYMLTNIVQ
jgi:hypothetical protein